MATSKTLAPTNVTISIPEMTDQPNASVLANCADKEADAINALNSHIGNKLDSPTDVSLNYNDTQDVNLVSGSAYLLIVTRINTSVTTTGGLYLIQSHSTASYVRPVIESTAATVTISGTVLTIGTNSNYTHFTLLRIL